MVSQKSLLIERHSVNEILDDVRLQRRQKVLEWLADDDFSIRHNELQNTRAENSGQWFVESKEFRNWVEGTGPNCLICLGIRLTHFLIKTDYTSGSREINSHVRSLWE